MKREDIIKQLVPGVIMGVVLGGVLNYTAGVNETNAVANFIGGTLACLVPTLLNCTIVVKSTAKVLNRELSVAKAFTNSIPEIVCSAIVGFVTYAVILTAILGINTCEFTRVGITVFNSILGIVVSTVAAYSALKKYEKRVKYTKRTKKEKKQKTK